MQYMFSFPGHKRKGTMLTLLLVNSSRAVKLGEFLQAYSLCVSKAYVCQR